ncbi:hypothetical protein [Cupriavidus sp. TKC]|uniref:hypothetical protein n=1 Tax=Cupriavidus sp. TKC TaxID=2880159 RepID=UPI00295F4A26|nr:hypothetical protein [Cupriavidus sp. TKC]
MSRIEITTDALSAEAIVAAFNDSLPIGPAAKQGSQVKPHIAFEGGQWCVFAGERLYLRVSGFRRLVRMIERMRPATWNAIAHNTTANAKKAWAAADAQIRYSGRLRSDRGADLSPQTLRRDP